MTGAPEDRVAPRVLPWEMWPHWAAKRIPGRVLSPDPLVPEPVMAIPMAIGLLATGAFVVIPGTPHWLWPLSLLAAAWLVWFLSAGHRGLASRLRYGQSLLVLEKIPVEPGSVLEARLEARFPTALRGLTARFVEKHRSHHVTRYPTNVLAESALSTDTTPPTVQLSLPVPGSDREGLRGEWFLVVEAAHPPYRAQFDLPVFNEREERRRHRVEEQGEDYELALDVQNEEGDLPGRRGRLVYRDAGRSLEVALQQEGHHWLVREADLVRWATGEALTAEERDLAGQRFLLYREGGERMVLESGFPELVRALLGRPYGVSFGDGEEGEDTSVEYEDAADRRLVTRVVERNGRRVLETRPMRRWQGGAELTPGELALAQLRIRHELKDEMDMDVALDTDPQPYE